MEKIIFDLERKFGRYAVTGLTRYIIASYCIGYVLQLTGLTGFINFNPYLILHGQIWRLVTWLMMPPSSLGIFTIIMLLFYYQIGMSLENTWGAFRYNLYILSGVVFTAIGAFIAFFITSAGSAELMGPVGQYIASFVSTYYVSMSIFLAFAASYPDMNVLLYFIIPIKIKWLGILDAVFIGYNILISPLPMKIIIIMSLLNFGLFFLSTRNLSRFNPNEFKRKADFKRAYGEADRSRFKVHSGGKASGVITKHKCAICGRTEVSNPELEFRFCSKCNGNYEYCNDHLYTHMHIE
ncbi:MAG: hypothetical protein J6P05_04205 [Lachnospiraceae bacterium]|nr:hypothetical protein [Lachnospiraceae bacterium]